MASGAAAVPCLLTSKGGGYFTAVAGKLTLNIQDVTGTTTINTSLTTVQDWTGASHTSVAATITGKSISFTLSAGRYYKVSIQCSQIPANTSSAHLAEPCGRAATTLDVTNLMPTLWIQA